MTESTMYWLTRLDHVHSFLNGFGALLAIVGIITTAASIVAWAMRSANAHYNTENHIDLDWKFANGVLKIIRPIAVLAVSLCITVDVLTVFIPTTREMAAIKVVPALASPENCQKLKTISSDILDVASDWLKDIKGKKNGQIDSKQSDSSSPRD